MDNAASSSSPCRGGCSPPPPPPCSECDRQGRYHLLEYLVETTDMGGGIQHQHMTRVSDPERSDQAPRQGKQNTQLAESDHDPEPSAQHRHRHPYDSGAGKGAGDAKDVCGCKVGKQGWSGSAEKCKNGSFTNLSEAQECIKSKESHDPSATTAGVGAAMADTATDSQPGLDPEADVNDAEKSHQEAGSSISADSDGMLTKEVLVDTDADLGWTEDSSSGAARRLLSLHKARLKSHIAQCIKVRSAGHCTRG